MDGQPVCPNCGAPAPEDIGDFARCRSCGWRGVVYDCHPRVNDLTPAEAAGLLDAACAHHPGKKAIAVCAGSGDYICSLCRVEMDGRDYSVQYLDREGQSLAARAFAPLLPRPDRLVCLMLVLSLIVPMFLPVGAIAATVFLYRHLRLPRENDLYRAVRMRVWPWLCWLWMASMTVMIVGLIVFGVIAERLG